MPENDNGVNFKYIFKFLGLFAVSILSFTTSSLYLSNLVYPESAAREIAVAPISDKFPSRTIPAVEISDVVPKEGKFIVADLEKMRLYLYKNGSEMSDFAILTKGRDGTPWETPGGFYSVKTKEESHFSSIGEVYMPYSMQFYGNYFIHGWPYYPGGTPVKSTFSGGCIRLSTKDAKEVFNFAERETGLFVYDSSSVSPKSSLSISPLLRPSITAGSYLVADIDTGDVYLEKSAKTPLPIASVTKLMTALVANEVISFETTLYVPDDEIATSTKPEAREARGFVIGDLLYPLLMESNNHIADALAQRYGRERFVSVMNSTAESLNMHSTYFSDPSGISPEDISTSDDLYRLAVYIANKKSFIWNITKTPSKVITSEDGYKFSLLNFNHFALNSDFIGGKVGHTTPAGDTMVSIFSKNIAGEDRRIAVIVLKSEDNELDTERLTRWFDQAVVENGSNIACANCAKLEPFRKIGL